jgi:hypothetical protein
MEWGGDELDGASECWLLNENPKLKSLFLRNIQDEQAPMQSLSRIDPI